MSNLVLTASQAAEANLCWGGTLTEESLVINRLAATVSYLYKKLEDRPLGLDKETIAKAINSELDWLTLDQCRYAANCVVTAIQEEG